MDGKDFFRFIKLKYKFRKSYFPFIFSNFYDIIRVARSRYHMKKIKILLFTILCITVMDSAKANTLNSLDTSVYIDNNGDGYVTEIWDYTADTGSESYHSFEQMSDRTITDFKVNMDGKDYTYVDYWNVDASKSAKAYKNGINYTSDGLELCHGIEYGNHIYTVTYTIKNLVWNYEDNQILYFSFLPQNMTTAPLNYKLTLYGDSSFEGVKYSSYGFNSTNTIEDGKIIFQSNGFMNSKEYVVALVGFPLNTFNTSITKSGTFDSVASDARKGATLNSNDETSLLDILAIIIPIVLTVGIFGVIIWASYSSRDRYDYTNYFIPKKVNNFRDLPFNKDIMLSYFTGIKEGIYKKENLIGMFLLKWIKEKKLTMVPTEGDGIFDFNKNDNYYLDLNNLKVDGNITENTLAGYLINAADSNKHLSPKAFKNWCYSNYEKINTLIEDAYTNSRAFLINVGYITMKNDEQNRQVYVLTNKLQDETIKLKGLKQFLNDMSLINEKKAIEVHVWDEYLIFATGFGIADKVAKQFKDFHPVEYNSADYYYYDNIYWVTSFSAASYTSAASAASAASSSGGSFSGGGFSSGGFSSGGGGIR